MIETATKISTKMEIRITGLEPYRLSARPPIQAKSALATMAMIPNTPILVTDQSSTPAA